MTIKPGQNLINVDIQQQRPNVNGWIVGFRPSLVNASDGKAPPVTEVHLHHAVWLVALKPTFAAGEEKTNINAPDGYGWRYTTKQFLVINHMIHDLSASPEEGLHHVHAVVHPRHGARGGVDQGDLDALDGRRGRQALPGVRRAARIGHRRHVHLPRPGARTPTRAGPVRNTLGRRPRRDARRRPPGTCIRAGCTPICSSRATA